MQQNQMVLLHLMFSIVEIDPQSTLWFRFGIGLWLQCGLAAQFFANEKTGWANLVIGPSAIGVGTRFEGCRSLVLVSHRPVAPANTILVQELPPLARFFLIERAVAAGFAGADI